MQISTIIKSIAKVSGITMISRILGYLRDVVIAAQMGTSMMNDIFIAAFKLANLFRNIFGEGALNASFVPVFSGLLATKKKSTAMMFAAHIQAILICSLIAFSIVMLIYTPFVVTITTPGFFQQESVFNLAVKLTRITFPYLALICITAFYGGIMSAFGIFSPFAATSVILNIVMICAALLSNLFETPAHALSYSVLLAGVLELLWMMFFANKYRVIVPIRKPKLTHEIKETFIRIGPSIIGSGVMQINILVDTIILSFIPSGMSYIYYADRIMQLPMALIGTTIGIVMLPALSRALELKQTDKLEKMVYQSFGMIMFFSIPAMAGLIYLAEEIIRALFMRGAFDHTSSYNTSLPLIALCSALPAFTLNKLLTTIFYSYKNTKTPMKIGIFTILNNAVLSLILLPFLKHVGVALASAISAWISIFIMMFILSSKGQLYLKTKQIAIEITKHIIATILMLALLFYVTNFVFHLHSLTLLQLSVTILFAIIIYAITSYLLKSDVVMSFLKLGN